MLKCYQSQHKSITFDIGDCPIMANWKLESGIGDMAVSCFPRCDSGFGTLGNDVIGGKVAAVTVGDVLSASCFLSLWRGS